MATYLPILKKFIYLSIYLSRRRWPPTYLLRRTWSPTYLFRRRWSPTYLGGDGHSPTYLGGDGHVYPPIWDGMACLLADLGSENHLSAYFEKLYLFTHLFIYVGGDCHPPIYLEGNGSTQHFKRGWSLPIYPPTYLQEMATSTHLFGKGWSPIYLLREGWPPIYLF